MGKGLWVESIQHSAWNENHDEVQPNAAKLLFSNKVELQPLDLVDSSFERHSNDFLQGTRDFFFARIGGGFPENGVKWVVENFTGLKLNVSLPENFSGAVFSPGPQRVSVAWKGGKRHQLCFARISDHLGPETQKKLEDVKEDVEEKLEDLKEDTIEIEQQARVSVPPATLPYIGFVHSLTIKNVEMADTKAFLEKETHEQTDGNLFLQTSSPFQKIWWFSLWSLCLRRVLYYS